MRDARRRPSVEPLTGVAILALTLGPLVACEEAPPPPPPARRRDAGPPPDAWFEPFEACVEVVSEPIVETRPRTVVDIIVVVDNSGSMSEEAAQVRLGINAFAEAIGASGLDYHVIVLSRAGTMGTSVCVPPPLGVGEPCSAPEPVGRLLHVPDVRIGSTDAPDIALASYPQYRDFLRPNAVKMFLWITDDQADMRADTFRSQLDALEPDGMFAITLHHAIVGFYGEAPDAWRGDRPGVCETLAAVGSVYLRLALCLSDSNAEIPDCNTGTIARVCERDWTATFAAIATRTERVLIEEPVSCTLALPAAPADRVLDLSRLSVTYTTEGETTVLGHGAVGAPCIGWRYDDDASPGAIVLCDEVCRNVQRDPGARLEVQVACYDDPD